MNAAVVHKLGSTPQCGEFTHVAASERGALNLVHLDGAIGTGGFVHNR